MGSGVASHVELVESPTEEAVHAIPMHFKK